MSLFSNLPKECIVLLEDVDSAGLENRGQTLKLDKDGKPQATQKISLSGLLNAIDGVAAPEGRILIMTTNHLDKLDPALIRPGRVDMKFLLDFASKQIAENMFFQTSRDHSGDKLERIGEKSSEDDTNEPHALEELKEMARAFAAEIPEKTLTPAEIQGYLMEWKEDPAGAVANIKEWLDKRASEKKVEEEKKKAAQAKDDAKKQKARDKKKRQKERAKKLKARKKEKRMAKKLKRAEKKAKKLASKDESLVVVTKPESSNGEVAKKVSDPKSDSESGSDAESESESDSESDSDSE